MKSPGIAPVAASEGGREPMPVAGGVLATWQSFLRMGWVQALVLAALYSCLAIFSLRIADVSDEDVWWHLRSAEWILQHHAVPYTDSFSRFGAGKPWAAYSWLFELTVAQMFRRLGMAGLMIFKSGMVLCIVAALYRMIRRLQADFRIAVLLTLAATFSMSWLYRPRPWLFTILFSTLEIDALMQARRTGRMRELAWLPVLFALWANLHIQFIDGLVVLGIALAEAVLARCSSGIQTRLSFGRLSVISIVCVGATLVNPYGWKIYQIAFDLATQRGVLNTIDEMLAPPFRGLYDWCALLLVLAAAGVLARARRFSFFETVLLAFAVVVSFRSRRDVFVLAIAASAILASGLAGNEKNRLRVKAWAAPLVVGAAGLALFLGFHVRHLDSARLRAQLAEVMPVRAVEAAQEKGWRGPLYNDYDWGGYLIWALRIPVSVDGRAALYGDQELSRSFATWSGQPKWSSDADLQKAGLVIGPVTAPLTQLLRMDPRFELVYEDKLAAVFITRRSSSSATK